MTSTRIIFQNEGLLDLELITTFGASVKESKSPIGQFGTGLKYAIAVLLREGCGIDLQVGPNRYQFGTQLKHIRGKDFQMVYYWTSADSPPVPCGFTTELGKHWELWMAYRELACNCMDEEGAIFKANWPEGDVEMGDSWHETQFAIRGDAFEKVWLNRHQYILEATPNFITPSMEITETPSNGAYFRKVKVGGLSKPALLTYNFTNKIELTEDRTMKWGWMCEEYVKQMLVESMDTKLISLILEAPKGTFEGDLDFSNMTKHSDVFKAIVLNLSKRESGHVNASAVAMVRALDKAAFSFIDFKLSRVQNSALDKAIAFCKRHGYAVDDYPIKVVQSLGENVLGMAMEGKIWLSERIFQLGGTKAVASTLIEEFLHLSKGYKDCTRELQQFLFDKLVSLHEEQDGEAL